VNPVHPGGQLSYKASFPFGAANIKGIFKTDLQIRIKISSLSAPAGIASDYQLLR
jgi:hypothetical protein